MHRAVIKSAKFTPYDTPEPRWRGVDILFSAAKSCIGEENILGNSGVLDGDDKQSWFLNYPFPTATKQGLDKSTPVILY